ncbi:hypothetical protein DRH27_02815 [Candidatus Falkowbacteria bacterium]|nr:MAG: hypothetical protein DRH27_02815 [Candidatus Falkowbacteria bacterium]
MKSDSDSTTAIIVSGWQVGKQNIAAYIEAAEQELRGTDEIKEIITSGEVVVVDFPDEFEEAWERREKIKWPVRERVKVNSQTRLLKRNKYFSGFVSESRGRHFAVKLNNSRY